MEYHGWLWPFSVLVCGLILIVVSHVLSFSLQISNNFFQAISTEDLKQHVLTVFTRKSTAALIKFFNLSLRHLFEGGAYLKLPTIILNLCFLHKNSIVSTKERVSFKGPYPFPTQTNNDNNNNNIRRISISALAVSKINKRCIIAGTMRRLFGDGAH